MRLAIWILIATEVSALASIALPVILTIGMDRWWGNFIGRYLMYQSIGFALILAYSGYIQAFRYFGWPPLPDSPAVLLAIFCLLASIKVFGVVTFLRVIYLRNRATTKTRDRIREEEIR